MRQSIALAAVVAVLLATPAYAYLDPGTGSMVLQAILAALAVGSAAVAGFWGRIRTLFGGRNEARRAADRDDAASRQ